MPSSSLVEIGFEIEVEVGVGVGVEVWVEVEATFTTFNKRIHYIKGSKKIIT